MKKHIIVSLLLFVPFISMAADHCTTPSEYTIDRRCYVTDEQKKEKPYNAIGGIVGPYGIDCTGTIIKQGDNLFFYTAKHCAHSKDITIMLVDGTNKTSHLSTTGNYKNYFSLSKLEQVEENPKGDWAIFIFDEKDIPFVNLSTHPQDKQALSLGYGSLKIMSDEEISELKNTYIEFLKNNESPYSIEQDGKYVPEGKITLTSENKSNYGFVDGGIKWINGYFEWFLRESNLYVLFDDNQNLKVSYCEYDSNGDGKADGCQGWQGDSGGGLFDSEGNLMAIRSTGKAIIGGTNHASAQDSDGYVNISTKTE